MGLRSRLAALAAAVALLPVFGCSAGAGDPAGSSDQGTAGTGGSGGAGSGGAGPATTASATTGSLTSTGSEGPDCTASSDLDTDGDGFSTNQGDCNDCDPNSNPGAIEVIGGAPPVDEDCNGLADDPPELCDTDIDLENPDPMAAARAIDLCQVASTDGFGVLSASYVRADGTPVIATPQVGILAGFGPNVNPQLGERMLGLSSGHARIPGQPDVPLNHMCSTDVASGCQNPGLGTAPVGFPQNSPDCPEGGGIYDDVGFEVALRAPTNATGYRFKFKFHSFEHAEWICTPYNDQFIALVDPAPPGAMSGNISFDGNQNPVSVNMSFFDVCDPAQGSDWALTCTLNVDLWMCVCPPKPNPYCPLGLAELEGNGFLDAFGTGFEDGGATRWLETTAPVTGGSDLTIRFAIWDTGDEIFDSTVLVDGFAWIADGGSVPVGTTPVRVPR